MMASASRKVVNVNKEALPSRLLFPGLSLEGICLAWHQHCPAYRKNVIGSLHYGDFKISSMTIFACPCCGQDVRANKVGVYQCQWRVANTHQWKTVKNSYQSYPLSPRKIHLETTELNDDDDDELEKMQHQHDAECSICLGEMTEISRCAILQCQHLFHLQCIHQWIDSDEESSLLCPLCRQAIFQ